MPKLPAFINRLRIFYFLAVLLTATFTTTSAQRSVERQLIENINKSTSDSIRLELMGELSRYYYANKIFDKGDSVFEKEIMLAESTLKEHLVLESYFKNTAYLITASETKQRTSSTMSFLRRALEYARANNLADYTALAYSHMAAINLSDGNPDLAFQNADNAYTRAVNTANDSIKVISTIQLGKVYEEKSDVVKAFRLFSNAQAIAIQSERPALLSPVYHAMAALYKKFGKEKEVDVRRYLNLSLEVNKELKNLTGQIYDNIALAKSSSYTASKELLHRAVQLADQTKNTPLKIEAERILFSYMLLEEKPEITRSFVEQREELKNVFQNTGPDYINWMYAEIYLYGGMPDTALDYFKKAENSFNTGYDLSTRRNFFNEYAYCYQQLNNNEQAVFYYKKSYDFARASSDLRRLKSFSQELKNLYEQQGNYQQAYQYASLYDRYKDSVDLLGRERDLALLEIENVTRQQQRDAELAKQKQQRQYNLQYMVITIVVILAFLLMIMIGMFKVSATMIRVMGFFSLIFFFEFIILIFDNWIHHLTHGEPWKVWLIKIGLISILLPIHHFLEHRIIRYLLSRHLIVLRSRLSLSNLLRKKKTARQKEIQEETMIREDLI